MRQRIGVDLALAKRAGLLWTALLFCAAAPLSAAPPPPDSPVADAAMRGDSEAVRVLLERGADVNAPQGDGMTALHWAAENGDAELAELLLDAGANLKAETRLGGYTPLHLAAKAGNAPVIRTLLEAGADPNAATTTGAVTPLHFAAIAGDPGAVGLLLDHGAEVNAREAAWGQTPLMFAAAYGRVNALELLLARGADTGITARVLDIPARDEADRADERRRELELEAIRAGAPPGSVARQSSSEPRPEADPQPESENDEPEGPERLSQADLVGTYGGLTALLLAVREGNVQAAVALLDAGAGIDQVSAGDHTPPLLMATINGHFDLAKLLLERGADPNLASDAGATPLYTTLNTQWIPKSRHPQPTDYMQQHTTYLQLMEALLEAGADPNVRLKQKLWYTTYGNDYLGVDRMGATPFWRAAYATDLQAMKLLLAYGANPDIPTMKAPERRRRGDDDYGGGAAEDPSGLPPVPVGGPGVWPIHAASGVGYGEGYAGNIHRHVPDGWLPTVKFLVEELGADVNARDLNGYNPVHHAAARGDNELILYLVEQGADVTAVSRDGQTTADMANGPVQRVPPYPETIELLESLGSKNNHNCRSC